MSFNPNAEYDIFVETAVTEVSKKIVPFEYLMIILHKYRLTLENLTPSKVGIPIPLFIQNETGFSIALALQPKSQGSVLAGNGIDESARGEMIEKIKVAEKIAASSIQSGKKIARKFSMQNVYGEEFDQDLEDVEDKRVARATIDLERRPPSIFDYANSSVTIGSNRKNPTHIFSENKVKYTQCFVKGNPEDGVFILRTPDASQAINKKLAKKGLIKVACEKGSENDTLIKLAYLLKARFDIEVILSDEVKTGKKSLRIASIDHEKISNEIDSQWTDFKENLSLGF